jgi:chromosome segregation ATPase
MDNFLETNFYQEKISELNDLNIQKDDYVLFLETRIKQYRVTVEELKEVIKNYDNKYEEELGEKINEFESLEKDHFHSFLKEKSKNRILKEDIIKLKEELASQKVQIMDLEQQNLVLETNNKLLNNKLEQTNQKLIKKEKEFKNLSKRMICKFEGKI